MAKTPKKSTEKSKKNSPKKPDKTKGSSPVPALKNTENVDEESRKLFLYHLNTEKSGIKALRARVTSAVAALRNAYKTAKAEGGFTKADFDTAIQLEDAEKEAKLKARIARQGTIARYMGSALGQQLNLFDEPDRTPAVDRAFDEGKMAAMSNHPAKPGYDPSTEQYRKYMEGYHSVSEQRVTEGIKPLNKKQQKAAAALAEAEKDHADAQAQKAANQEQRDGDAKAFDAGAETKAPELNQTSGVPTTRSQFIAQQRAQQEREAAEGSAFSKKN